MAARPALLAPLAAGLLLSVLSPAATAAAPWSDRGGDPVEVEVRERPGDRSEDEVWEVRWRLPEPAAGVEFVRGRHAFRHELWGIAPEGSSWSRALGRERLCFPAPARHVAASFRTDFAARAGEAAVNARFGEGGRLLSTAPLIVRPLADCAAPQEGTADATAARPAVPPHRFRFLTAEARALRVRERAGEGELEWSPASGEEETYALFGAPAARQSARAVLVVDAALPPWIAEQAEGHLPPLFDRYTAETGIPLAAPPLVLLGTGEAGSGRAFAASSAPGVLVVTFSGAGWAERTAEAERELFVRLARAAFRPWSDGELRPDEESAWLAEAAAGAFALRAAWSLETMSYAGYEAAVVDSANACLVTLDAGPLISAPERGAGDAWGACGPALLFAADRAVERGTPGQGGISLLFRRMFEEGRGAGDRYGTGVFLGWLDKLSGERDTVHALQRFVRRGVERGADAFLHQLLGSAGLRLALVAPEEASDSPALRTLLHEGLTRCACGTALPESSADPDCARFAPHDSLGRVGGVEVASDAPGAYGRFRSAALLGSPLEVITEEEAGPVTLFCERDVLDARVGRLLRLEPPP